MGNLKFFFVSSALNSIRPKKKVGGGKEEKKGRGEKEEEKKKKRKGTKEGEGGAQRKFIGEGRNWG